MAESAHTSGGGTPESSAAPPTERPPKNRDHSQPAGYAAGWFDGLIPVPAQDVHWPGQPAMEPGMARLVLPATPESARPARDFARKQLADWGLEQLTDNAVLVMAELLANAIAHATPRERRATHFQIVLIRYRHRLAVIVTDAGIDPPTLVPTAEQPLFAESGRGLHIVAALSQQWGWAWLATGGKAVWALLDDPDQPSPH